jgi:hypothetical protein
VNFFSISYFFEFWLKIGYKILIKILIVLFQVKSQQQINL